MREHFLSDYLLFEKTRGDSPYGGGSGDGGIDFLIVITLIYAAVELIPG